MIHITLPQLCAYIDGELTEASTELVRRHLSDCMECTEQFAGLEAQDEILLRIFADDPGDAFFQNLSASIPIGQPSRPKPVASAAGKKASRAHPMRRAEDQHARSRVAWVAVTTCILLVASAAWVVLRPRGGTSPSLPTPMIAEPGVETGSGSSPEGEQVVRRGALVDGGSGQQEAPLSEPSAEPASLDDEEYSTPEPSVPKAPSSPADRAAVALREAKSASLEAARTKLPWAFDRAANAWEYSLPLFGTSPETLAMARREVAQSRFQAWAAEPTPARHEAAVASARQYLLYAPPGPDRDLAWTWLARLKH